MKTPHQESVSEEPPEVPLKDPTVLQLLERFGDAFASVDREWRFTAVSAKAGEIFGRDPASLLGKSLWEEFLGAGKEPFAPAYRRAMDEQVFVELEEYYKPIGRWVEKRLYPKGDGLLIIIHDITERKDAEALARGQNDVMERIARSEPLPAILDALMRLLEAQRPNMLCSVLLMDPDGTRVRHGAAPSLPDDFNQAIDGESIGPAAGSCGTAAYRRTAVIVSDIASDPLWADYRELALAHDLRACWSTPILDAEDSLLGTFAIYYREPARPAERDRELIGIATHIASIAIVRARNEEALRRSEERYRTMLEGMLEGCFVISFDWRYLYLNEAASMQSRKPGEEMIGRAVAEIWPDTENPALWECARRCMTERVPMRGEVEFSFPGGAKGWFDVRCQPVAEGIFVLSIDITERKRAEDRLKMQFAVTSVLASARTLPDVSLKLLEIVCREFDAEIGALWILDRGTQRLRCIEVWHPPDRESEDFAVANLGFSFARSEGLLGEVWNTGKAQWRRDVSTDKRLVRRPGPGMKSARGWIAFPFKIRDEVVGVAELFSFREIQEPEPEMFATLAAIGVQIGLFIERRQLAEQFRQSQKMEAIGTLAGGIAHDFNNVLAAINGFAELAKAEAAGNRELTENLDAILLGTHRAIDLVRQILAFSRQQELQRKPIQLEGAVQDALRLLRATIGPSIAFETRFAPNLPDALADATQVQQVMMNLCTNSAHAMRNREGLLTISLERVDLRSGTDLASTVPELRPGVYLRLSVSDTGHGMDRATIGRIFEPFFTTKPPGEGTGLGLPVVHGIMQSHEGTVTAYSHPGEGTTFHLYFPACESRIPPVEQPPPKPLPGSGERILLVDDEEALVKLGKKILERLGYAVDGQTKPAEALAAIEADPRKYDLVITDQMMPGMTGANLAEKVHQLRPELPVILNTGYTAALHSDQLQAFGIRKILLKPMSIETLSEAVRTVLKEARAAGGPQA